MTTPPAVTVVTPTRNRVALLAETMASVRRQTLADWEHIIVDDGDDPATAEAVRVAAAGDSRVRYLGRKGPVAGANFCRNLGIEQAAADLVVLLDDDDWLRPDCLARRVEIMRRNADLDFAVFRARIFDREVGDPGTLYHGQDPADDLLRFLSLECPWQTTGPIWRRAFLQRIGGFDESLISMQDLEMHVRALAARGRYSCFAEVDHDIRCTVDATRTSTRHFSDPAFLVRAEAVPAHLLRVTAQAGLLNWSRRRALLGLAHHVSESWARAGRLGDAMRNWRKACRVMDAPLHLALQGRAMLFIIAMSGKQNGLGARLFNRWKGQVRFRQEPALIDISGLRHSGSDQ